MRIMVIPFGEDGGYKVTIDGEPMASFISQEVAMSHHADLIAAHRKLQKAVNDHAGYLHSRTPDEVSNLSVHRLRDLANSLRDEASG